jgi:hypothetical protein
MPTITVDGLKVIYSNSAAAADITLVGSEDQLSSPTGGHRLMS